MAMTMSDFPALREIARSRAEIPLTQRVQNIGRASIVVRQNAFIDDPGISDRGPRTG